MDVGQWRQIQSSLNPADEASRGLSVEQFLTCKRWFKGPEQCRPIQLWGPRQDNENGPH